MVGVRHLQDIYDNAYQRDNNHGVGVDVKVLVHHAIERKVEEERGENPYAEN